MEAEAEMAGAVGVIEATVGMEVAGAVAVMEATVGMEVAAEAKVEANVDADAEVAGVVVGTSKRGQRRRGGVGEC